MLTSLNLNKYTTFFFFHQFPVSNFNIFSLTTTYIVTRFSHSLHSWDWVHLMYVKSKIPSGDVIPKIVLDNGD